MRLDWFDLVLLIRVFAVGLILALAVSWKGWGRLFAREQRD